MTERITHPQVFIWADRRVKPTKKRKFTYLVSQMPDKYRMNSKTAWEWVRRHLSKKYGIPEKHIREIMSYSAYATVNGRPCTPIRKKKGRNQ